MLRNGIAWAIVLLLGLSCRTQLYRELSEEDANRVLEELARERIPARKVVTDGRRGTFAVEVPDGAASRALSLLGARDVVRPRREGLSSLTRGSSILPSAEEQRIRYYVALSAELERTLEALSGVQRARVHLALPGSQAPFPGAADKFVPTRASVMLKVREKEFDLQAEEIQSLVAGALVDMPRAEVAVVVQPVTVTPAPELEWTQVGPVLLTSRWAWALVLLFFLPLVAAVAMGLHWLRARRSRAAQAQAGADARSAGSDARSAGADARSAGADAANAPSVNRFTGTR